MSEAVKVEQVAIKFRTYKIGKGGKRGANITIPRVWLDDVNAGPGDLLDMFRTTDDQLILVLKPRGAEAR